MKKYSILVLLGTSTTVCFCMGVTSAATLAGRVPGEAVVQGVGRPVPKQNVRAIPDAEKNAMAGEGAQHPTLKRVMPPNEGESKSWGAGLWTSFKNLLGFTETPPVVAPNAPEEATNVNPTASENTAMPALGVPVAIGTWGSITLVPQKQADAGNVTLMLTLGQPPADAVAEVPAVPAVPAPQPTEAAVPVEQSPANAAAEVPAVPAQQPTDTAAPVEQSPANAAAERPIPQPTDGAGSAAPEVVQQTGTADSGAGGAGVAGAGVATPSSANVASVESGTSASGASDGGSAAGAPDGTAPDAAAPAAPDTTTAPDTAAATPPVADTPATPAATPDAADATPPVATETAATPDAAEPVADTPATPAATPDAADATPPTVAEVTATPGATEDAATVTPAAPSPTKPA